MKGAPRSEQFDDIYFSAEDGLAETQHVFLESNNLPQAWNGKDTFVIGEMGFGTGLNFFAVWKLFEENSKPHQTLDFISVEKYPLTPDEIKEAMQPWADYFGSRIEDLINMYPIRIAGFHRVKINKKITLTLIFDDVNYALPQVQASVDCWFLDGFAPAKNPDMWTKNVFDQMARLSKSEANFATFTAAGDVRRGLQEAGFTAEKKKGFGYKRDMTVGRFLDKEREVLPQRLKQGAKIAIIGGGLAGTSCAYTLKQYGFEPVIYEASDCLAAGASGNNYGIFNPRFSKFRDELSDFFAPAYAQLIRTAKQAGEAVEYDPCGALHLMNATDKAERLQSMAQHWFWHSDHARVVDSKEASEIAGIDLSVSALYLQDSGSVSPRKLCEYYAQDIEVQFNHKIENLNLLEADAIIICNASSAQEYDELLWLKLDAVRGQITQVKASDKTNGIKCNIHYGGYISAARNGLNFLGSTFQKWIDHTEVLEKDHQLNLEGMREAVPSLCSENLEPQKGWAGFRAATNDRFPVVGCVPEAHNIFVSTAFGSHGIVSSIAAAHYIADLVRGGPLSLSQKTSNSLLPKRFLDRKKKRQGVTA